MCERDERLSYVVGGSLKQCAVQRLSVVDTAVVTIRVDVRPERCDETSISVQRKRIGCELTDWPQKRQQAVRVDLRKLKNDAFKHDDSLRRNPFSADFFHSYSLRTIS